MKPERRGGTLVGCIESDRAGCRAGSCGRRSRPATTPGCSPTDAWTSSGTGTSISIAGPDTHAQLFAARGRVDDDRPAVRARLRAAGAGRARPHELTDQRVPLDAVWAAGRVRRVTELVAASPDPGACARGRRASRDCSAARRRRRARRAGRRSSPAPDCNSTTIARPGRAQHPPAPAPEHRGVRLRRQDAEPDPAHAASAGPRTRAAYASPTRRRAPATPISRTSPATSRTWPAFRSGS